MTSDYYPALAPRRKRRMLFRTGEIYGMYAKNGILLVEDGNLVYTDKRNERLADYWSACEKIPK